MTLVRLNNWMPELSGIMNNYFDRSPLFNDSFNTSTQPSVNIYESDNDFQIEVAAPGFKKKDFNVEVNNDVLTISATKETKEPKDLLVRKRQFSYESFERTFNLPKQVVDDSTIKANYEDGILYITIGKKEEVKPKPARLIEIA